MSGQPYGTNLFPEKSPGDVIALGSSLKHLEETSMPYSPHRGDLLLRSNLSAAFDLLDALTYSLVQSHIATVPDAIAAARAHGAKTIWQQTFDNRGRPMGDPFLLMQPPKGGSESPPASD